MQVVTAKVTAFKSSLIFFVACTVNGYSVYSAMAWKVQEFMCYWF